MSYLLEQTQGDEILLMIAAEEGGTRPEPSTDESMGVYGTLKGQPFRQSAGFCHLNFTENLRALWQEGLIYEHPRNYRVIHLTWKGWDRVDELVRAGERLPTEEHRGEYAQLARICLENDLHPDRLQRVSQPDRPGTLATYRYVTDQAVATIARFWFRQPAVLLASRSNLRPGPRPIEYRVERHGWIMRWHVVGYQAKLIQ